MLILKPLGAVFALVPVVVLFAASAVAQERASEAAPPLDEVAPPAQDCKDIAARIGAAFPGSSLQLFDTGVLVGGDDDKSYRDIRWDVDLPGGHVVVVPCARAAITVNLDDAANRAAAEARLLSADRSAEVFSGAPVEKAAAKCIAAAVRRIKKAGKVGFAHAREIAATPHYEGGVTAGKLKVFCSYDYRDRKDLSVTYHKMP